MQEFVSKCGNTKVFLKVVFEAWVFLACNLQQNQTDLTLLYVAINKTWRQKCCKTKWFCYGRRWNIFMWFVKNIFLLLMHEKIVRCPRSFKLFHLYCNSLMCLAVLLLEITPKVICNCNIAFDRLIRKHATHEMCTNAIPICI